MDIEDFEFGYPVPDVVQETWDNNKDQIKKFFIPRGLHRTSDKKQVIIKIKIYNILVMEDYFYEKVMENLEDVTIIRSDYVLSKSGLIMNGNIRYCFDPNDNKYLYTVICGFKIDH